MNRELKNLKIDPSNIKNRVKHTLNSDLLERRMYMKYKIQKIAAIAASFAVVSAASAFAVTPTGQAAIENIISYFQDKRAVELTSYEELSKYNEEIGVSASNLGYTLTLDNVAADDNFIHVFFTLTSDEMPFYENGNTDKILGLARDFWEECKINGQSADIYNHNDYEGYFTDDHTYKGVNKYNVASMNIPDNFKLDFSLILDAKSPGDDSNTISVSADIDKSKIKVATITKEVNQPLWDSNNVIEKIIFSPFGNQFIIKTDMSKNQYEDDLASIAPSCGGFALFDENGTSLDILNTDLSGVAPDGVSRNSFEFLKAGTDTKTLSFVPVKYEINDPAYKQDSGDTTIKQKIGSYPLVFEVSDVGKVIVTDVRISDGLIEIDYYYDGYVIADAEFGILDDRGNNVYPESNDKNKDIRCLYDIDIDHKNSSYTAKYQYYCYDENDRMIPADEANSDFLTQKFTTLSLSSEAFVQLDYDNAITVDIK